MNENQNEYVDINAHDNYPDSDEKIEIPTMKVIPLKKICMTIGELPSSYLETMTYYEMLVWFVEYLKNNIIPTINNNASAIQEVQSVVLALQTYINNYKDSIDSDVEELEEYMNNYFENLDVQEEINNKLDEMLEDGVLEQIIEQFLQLTTLICFDNVADMKLSPNLANGSYAKTLGYYSKNDGGSALYKIRTITNDDVVNETTIIALNDDTLIAELIVENSIYNAKWFGLKTDGSDNTTLFNNMITAIDLSKSNTIYFPHGKYVFNSPLTLTRRINLCGEEISITDTDSNYGSVLSFTGLNENSTCLTLPATKVLIKDLMFLSNSYSLTDTRSNIGKGVDVFTETITTSGINGIGFSGTPYGTTIKNCRFRGFSNRGINGNTFLIIDNCSFWECKDGCTIISDVTISNNRFFDVERGIVSTGSNNLILNNRMDSVRHYGIQLNSGNSNIIDNLNVDYCQYNAVYIFNNGSTIVKNIEARCGTIYPYDSTTDGNINAFYPINEYSKYLGLVQLAGYSNQYLEIETSARSKNPLDTSSNYKVSLFGVTSINTPHDIDIHCYNDDYFIGSGYYIDYFKKALLICEGNFKGNIYYKGYALKITDAVQNFSSANWSKMLISDFSTPTQ